MDNMFFKVLCSLPIILLVSYFVPVLGVCLLTLRFFAYRNQKFYKTAVYLFICSLLIHVPRAIVYFVNVFKLKVNIKPITDIVSNDLYKSLQPYSKTLIIFGIVSLIVYYIIQAIFNKLNKRLDEYVQREEKKFYEIRQKNDLIMQEKREKAKNTHVVTCPYCGSSNTLTEKTGTCEFCRREIEYNE